MKIFSRTKRVTDPLDDEAKSRMFRQGCILDQDSPQLCDLVHAFLEDGQEDDLRTFHDFDSSESSANERTGEASEEIVKIAVSFSDPEPYANLLLTQVLRAVEAYSSLRTTRKSIFQDKVAIFLQELGHDAAVCTSKWSSTCKLIAGSYEFIDVIYKPSNDQTAVRYFVDLYFASEFEIARPTREYSRVLQLLPQVFVGKEENLRTIVRETCDAAKRSLKCCGLSLPPWRRSSYLQHKWFGPYKRRVGSCLGLTSLNKDVVRCRFLGFDNAVNTRLFIRT